MQTASLTAVVRPRYKHLHKRVQVGDLARWEPLSRQSPSGMGRRARLSFEGKCLQYRGNSRNVATYQNCSVIGVCRRSRITVVERSGCDSVGLRCHLWSGRKYAKVIFRAVLHGLLRLHTVLHRLLWLRGRELSACRAIVWLPDERLQQLPAVVVLLGESAWLRLFAVRFELRFRLFRWWLCIRQLHGQLGPGGQPESDRRPIELLPWDRISAGGDREAIEHRATARTIGTTPQHLCTGRFPSTTPIAYSHERWIRRSSAGPGARRYGNATQWNRQCD